MIWLFKKLVAIVMDMIEVFVVSMSVFIVIYLFLMQPHQVKGSSMYPTFYDKEYLMTDKITYKRQNPERGEIVVFKAPINESFDFIKRVIAIPGDTVKIQAGKVWLNGEVLEEPYLPSSYSTQAGRYLREGKEFVVPADTYITFGDNRDHSSDSREWGPVPFQNIVGRVFFRYWPFQKAGWVDKSISGELE